MDPRPDHGETGYKGSGRLLGRKALITRGDSGMGRAAAMRMLAKALMWISISCLQEEPEAPEVIELIRAAGRLRAD